MAFFSLMVRSSTAAFDVGALPLKIEGSGGEAEVRLWSEEP